MTLAELIICRTEEGKVQWTGPHGHHNRYPDAITFWECCLRDGGIGIRVVLDLWKRLDGSFFLNGWSEAQAHHRMKKDPHNYQMHVQVLDVEATQEQLQALMAAITASLDLNDLDIIKTILEGL